MAISKLMHMKETAGNPARHLKRAIEYIMNPEKTKNRQYVGINHALHLKEISEEQIYDRMIYTKRLFGKEWGRQGYHFVISFAKEDDITPEDAMHIIDEIQQEYLKDSYECVYAIHTNTEHLHGHLIFNSVDRYQGMKYHYKKGDWEKEILPCVNKVCKKWGLKELDLEDRSNKERYGKQKNKWDTFLRKEIDDIVCNVNTYQEFLLELTNRDYEWKDGKYLSICPKNLERKKFRRTAQLGKEYTKERLQERILQESKDPQKKDGSKVIRNRHYRKKNIAKSRGIQKRILFIILQGEQYKSNRLIKENRIFYYEQKKYMKQLLYLQRRGYHKKSQVSDRNRELWNLEKELQKMRKRIYNQNQQTKKNKEYKATENYKQENLKKINRMLQEVRKEKQMTYQIMKEIEHRNKKIIQKELSKK